MKSKFILNAALTFQLGEAYTQTQTHEHDVPQNVIKEKDKKIIFSLNILKLMVVTDDKATWSLQNARIELD